MLEKLTIPTDGNVFFLKDEMTGQVTSVVSLTVIFKLIRKTILYLFMEFFIFYYLLEENNKIYIRDIALSKSIEEKGLMLIKEEHGEDYHIRTSLFDWPLKD